MEKEVYVTLATSDFYAYGCIVLGHSLLKTGTRRKLVALVTDDVSWNISQTLQPVFDLIERVPKLNLSYAAEQDTHPDFSSSLAKIHCWRLTQFSKGVFLNADTLVLQNCDELFERSEISAVPDVEWPDYFNSGVFVFEPSLDTYWSLSNLVKQRWHRDGGDQHILNLYFNPDWKTNIQKRLPFMYNLVCSSIYTYAPAFQQFGKRVKIVHFSGHPKPWNSIWNSTEGTMAVSSEINFTFRPFHQTWLEIFKDEVFPHLPKFPVNEVVPNQLTVTDVMSNLINHPEGTINNHNQEQKHSFEATFRSISPILPLQTYDRTFQPLMSPKPKSHLTRTSDEVSQKLVSSLQQMSFTPKVEKLDTKMVHSFEEVTHTPPSFVTYEEETEPSVSQVHLIDFTGREREEQAEEQAAPSNRQHTPSQITNNKETEASLDQADDKLKIKDDETRKKQWEEGNVDYLGQDTFDNIWKHLSSIIEQTPEETVSETSDQSEAQLPPPSEVQVDTTEETKIDAVTSTEVDILAVVSDKLKEEDSANAKIIKTEKNELPGYPLDDYTGMYEWEQGRIDYTGRDSSENIIQRLDFLIKNKNYKELLKDPLPMTTY